MNSIQAALDRHRNLVVIFSAMLFGIAYGLDHERDIVPIPGWYSANLGRFCFALMAWTALMQRSPLQLLAWSGTDFVVLSLPFFAGVMFVPDLHIRDLFAYEIVVGNLAAGGVLGVSVCQAVLSLFATNDTPPSRREPNVSLLSRIFSRLHDPDCQPAAAQSAADPRHGILVKRPRGVVLFLDIDGVLHPCQSGSLRHMPLFEQWLLAHPSVDVVISSTWRETHSFMALRALFPASIRDRIIGTTPIFEDHLREDEIQHFARRHGIAHWFCIDDQVSDFPSIQDSRLVATEYLRGITAETLQTMSRIVEALCPHTSR